MRAIVITERGGPEVLRIAEKPDPVPGPGEVLIDVRASGVNFADLMARMGLYPEAPPLHCVVGYEVAGLVSKLGPGVQDFQLGDRVVAFTRFGGYAERAISLTSATAIIPDGMDFNTAAAIPANYLTAYHMLFRVGSLLGGQTVLVQAAAGGVGTAVADLVKVVGARMIGISSPSKFDYLRDRGVEHLVSSAEDVTAAVMRITGRRGVDLVLDSAGGPGLRKSYDLLAPGGRLIILGMSSLAMTNRAQWLRAAWRVLAMPCFWPLKLFSENRGAIGVNMNHFMRTAPETTAQEFKALLDLYCEGKINPHVDATFPPERAGDAHQYLHERRNMGKVLIVWA